MSGQAWSLGLRLGLVALLTGLVLTGIRRSSAVNLIIVSVTVLALVAFAILGATAVSADNLTPFFRSDGSAYGPLAKLFEATALMFVAFTGYGRIATLGEEVRSPERTIPRAIVATLLVYYAVNNLAALALPAHQRRYPKILAWLGLAGCLFLAFHLKPVFWATGLGLVALGLGWKWALNRRRA